MLLFVPSSLRGVQEWETRERVAHSWEFFFPAGGSCWVGGKKKQERMNCWREMKLLVGWQWELKQLSWQMGLNVHSWFLKVPQRKKAESGFVALLCFVSHWWLDWRFTWTTPFPTRASVCDPMDRSVYGEGDTSPYGVNYNPFRLTKKDTPAPGCKFLLPCL